MPVEILLRLVRSLVLLNLVLLLFSIWCAHGDVKLYVKPVQSSNPPCHCPPGERCETLDFYNALQDTYDIENNNLTLVFLCGYHTLENSTTTTTTKLNVSKLHYFAVQGDGSEASRVVIRDITFVVQSVPKLHLENLTIMDINFKVYPTNSKERVSFHVKNCQFVRSNCLVIGSDLNIENSVVLNGTNTAFNLVSSTLTLTGNVTFSGNTGEKGGALGLTSAVLNISRNANITFSHNTATQKGGAIFVNNPTEIFKVFPYSDCFYHLLDYNENATYSVSFTENFATKGGSHIFGASLKSYCTAAENELGVVPSYKVISLGEVFHLEKPELEDNPIDSAVTGSPARVCICDESGLPQCLDPNKIFMSNVTHYPGELFTLNVALAAGDFGTTIGIVHAHLLEPHLSDDQQPALEVYQYGQVVHSTMCTKLNYTLYSRNSIELLSLTAVKSNLVRNPNQAYEQDIKTAIDRYYSEGVIEGSLIFTPLFMEVTFVPCPLGFSIAGNTSGCDCYPPLKLAYKDLKCLLVNSSSYLSHPHLWIGTSTFGATEVALSRFCPLCNQTLSEKPVDLRSPKSIDAQCAFDHAGRLCGGCKEGYSLAIGSSHCVRCLNNNNLALLIFFVVAGFLLVLFVSLLNLTVTQGMINGVIFYANIIWVYETILFPQESTGVLLFLKVFIAWLNLDFGIETCFAVGLNAFWKALLQCVFPMYIWSIVGFIIFGARHSTRLTKLLGSRAVSVLSTLVLLSYMKLLRNAIMSLGYAHLDYYSSEERVRSLVVWATDGRLSYFGIPHIFLFLAALIVICLCLPYTLVLFLGQWLRGISFFTRFHPIFDSYFAPLKNKHHYWPGVLLLARVFLYVIRITLYNDEATFVLLITIVSLLSYMSIAHPQKSAINFILQSAFLVNLIILSGGILFVDGMTTDKGGQAKKIFYVTGVSTAVAFAEFCLIVVSCSVKSIPYSRFRGSFRRWRYRKSGESDTLKNEQPLTTSYTSLRDSILDESLPSQVLVSY